MRARTLLVSLLLALATHAAAQYPTRAVRILVPIPPGGAPDIAARVVSEKLAEALGQPVIVENRPGSNGNVASEVAARSPADGHTLLLCADSQIVINPHLYSRMPIDPMKDLVPVASVAANQFILAVHPSLPVKDFREFIEYARKARPPLLYGSGGNGSQHHLTMEMLKARAGIDLTHVPYKGGSPAAIATVAGEVQAMFSGTSAAAQVTAGRLRGLATTGRTRAAILPDLPTIAEFYPGFANTIWLGLFAPAGTPDPVLGRLRHELDGILAMPDVKLKFNRAGGLEAHVTSPKQFADEIAADYAKYAQIIKAVGIKVD